MADDICVSNLEAASVAAEDALLISEDEEASRRSSNEQSSEAASVYMLTQRRCFTPHGRKFAGIFIACTTVVLLVLLCVSRKRVARISMPEPTGGSRLFSLLDVGCASYHMNVCRKDGHLDPDCCAPVGHGSCSPGYHYERADDCDGGVSTCCRINGGGVSEMGMKSVCAHPSENKCTEDADVDGDCCAMPGHGSCMPGYIFSEGPICFKEFGAVASCCAKFTHKPTEAPDTTTLPALVPLSNQGNPVVAPGGAYFGPQQNVQVWQQAGYMYDPSTGMLVDPRTRLPIAYPNQGEWGAVGAPNLVYSTETATSTSTVTRTTSTTQTITSTTVTTTTVTTTTITTTTTSTKTSTTTTKTTSTSIFGEFIATEKSCAPKGADCTHLKCCSTPGMVCFEKTPGDWATCDFQCVVGGITPGDTVPWTCKELRASDDNFELGNWPEESCLDSKRCNLPGKTCFQKNGGYATCMDTCEKGRTDEFDKSPWQCEPVGGYVRPPPLTHAVVGAGASLFCFAVAKGDDKLLEAQRQSAWGIFACDEGIAYSPDDGDPWLLAQKDGHYKNFDWVVKVDLDVVFFPSRLRQRIGALRVPPNRDVYLSTEPSMDDHLLVLTPSAMDLYLGGRDKCNKFFKTLKTHLPDGSDTRLCLEAHGVRTAEGLIPVGGSDCANPEEIGFWSFPKREQWQACWETSGTAFDGSLSLEATLAVEQAKKLFGNMP